MNPLSASALRLAPLGALLAACCAPAQAALDLASQDRLQSLGRHPALAGDLIYKGRTFAQDEQAVEPLFHYERRLQVTPTAHTATHLTWDADSRDLVIAEEAVYGPQARLRRFTALNRQSGLSAVVEVSADGRQLHFSVNDNGVVSLSTETVDRPVVAGPTLFGFVLAHAAQLAAGSTVPVRMIVPADKRSYGLDIRRESVSAGQVVYTIAASDWWLRPFLATMRLVVDTHRHTVQRYEGRVPPMRHVGGSWRALDARVEYTPVSTPYR